MGRSPHCLKAIAMHRLLLVIPLCLGLPESATAAQPISESFVECAQLFDLSNRAHPSRRDTENGAMLRYAAEQMMSGAHAEAETEGRKNIPAYLEQMAQDKACKWDEKGGLYVMTQDFRDWAAYCRSLAQSRGISLKP
jgi:hypothetical protein